MAQILDGRATQTALKQRLVAAIAALPTPPHLAIIQVGNVPASSLYIARKKEFGESIGARVPHHHFAEAAPQAELEVAITQLNTDSDVHGIIIQIPIPAQLDKLRLLNLIDPAKDVDGLGATNLARAWERLPGHTPATARGVVTLLEHYNIPLAAARVVVIGRSALVGKPIALAALNHNATVTICHRATANLATVTQAADILIVAAGAPGLIGAEHVRPGQVVIDVGINLVDHKVTGDVRFAEVAPIVRALSPVPGGVGPMTIACLFQNLLDAYTLQA